MIKRPFQLNQTAFSFFFVIHFFYFTNTRVTIDTAQKMKFPIKDFFSKWDQIRSFLRI